MISVSDAQALVLQHTQPLPPETKLLDAAALGLVLSEDVASDLDMPPYDKALMDGYAVRSADLPNGRGNLHVVEELTAGHTPQLPVQSGQATRIMTGAPIPAGADAVVQVERTRTVGDYQVEIDDRPPRPGQNIMPQGREMRRGDVVLTAGSVLRPQEFGLLGSVGRTALQVYPAPRVAILSTGDEIVEASQVPGPGQIRNGNGSMLLAQVFRGGGVPIPLGIARDEVKHLRQRIQEGLQESVLVLSGGVSAGDADLVPGVLQDMGVSAHFHKVAMKPGKPVFFGTTGQTLVFGLPGNPVSSYVCFELFVRPALRRLRGHSQPGPRMLSAVLAEDFAYRSDRPTYYPVHLDEAESGRRFRPVPWHGSPDLRGLLRSNAFALIPPGDHQHRAGQQFSVLCVEP